MAEGFLRALSDGQLAATSAGLEVSIVDPLAVQVMAEEGIDISQRTSKPLSDFNPDNYNVVFSLCGCDVNLPPEWVLRDIFENWQLDDPTGKNIKTFQQVRDEVKARVIELIQTMSYIDHYQY
ncbi:arsenate reductase, glutathione/glutaredoxin type [Leptolyngbya sp. PL-A3]